MGGRPRVAERPFLSVLSGNPSLAALCYSSTQDLSKDGSVEQGKAMLLILAACVVEVGVEVVVREHKRKFRVAP